MECLIHIRVTRWKVEKKTGPDGRTTQEMVPDNLKADIEGDMRVLTRALVGAMVNVPEIAEAVLRASKTYRETYGRALVAGAPPPMASPDPRARGILRRSAEPRKVDGGDN